MMARRDILKTTALGLSGLSSAADEKPGFIDAHVHVWTNDFKKYPLDSGFTPKDAKTIEAFNPNIVLESYKGANGDNIAFNSGKPPFSDVRVRQAIFKAIDKQQLIDTVLEGKGWYYAGVFMPREDWFLYCAAITSAVRRLCCITLSVWLRLPAFFSPSARCLGPKIPGLPFSKAKRNK